MYYIYKIFQVTRWCIRKIINFFSFTNPYKENWLFIKDFIDVSKMKPATGALRERQLAVLNFAKEVNKLLEEHNIKAILGYGNLLGAERHGGFIPWDDDIDFDMSREDYEKLIKLAKEKYIYIKRPQNRFWSLYKQFEFEDELLKKYPNCLIFVHAHSMIQIYKGTSLRDYCICDFFSLDYYADDYEYKTHLEYVKNIKKKLQSINNYPKEIDFLEKEIKSNPDIVEHSNKIMYGIDSETSFTEAMIHGEWYEEKDWYPLKKIKFEDTEFWAPNNHIKILEHEFGSWKELPSNLGFSLHLPDIQNYLNKKYGKNKH
jgi:lipopolysaccharide cholinephosphotransferase